MASLFGNLERVISDHRSISSVSTFLPSDHYQNVCVYVCVYVVQLHSISVHSYNCTLNIMQLLCHSKSFKIDNKIELNFKLLRYPFQKSCV